jgi:hypothetical protein
MFALLGSHAAPFSRPGRGACLASRRAFQGAWVASVIVLLTTYRPHLASPGLLGSITKQVADRGRTVQRVNTDWWKRRWEAFLDNAIFYGVVALGTAAVALTAAYGTEDATLPLWLVVLFGVVQVLTVIAVVVLFRSARATPTTSAATPAPTAPPPHPHAPLLARIDTLLESVRNRKMEGAVPWPIASTFNRILSDARDVTPDPVLDDIEMYQREGNDQYAYSGYIDALEASLAQIRVVVEHASE